MYPIGIELINRSGRIAIPKRATSGAAAFDLQADLEEPIRLYANQRKFIPCGFKLALPENCVAYVHARSGLALKHGITMANAVGVIDSDYRGEVGAIVHNIAYDEDNFNTAVYEITPGVRIAQLVILRLPEVEFQETKLDFTPRGEGGFGSTGQ